MSVQWGRQRDFVAAKAAPTYYVGGTVRHNPNKFLEDGEGRNYRNAATAMAQWGNGFIHTLHTILVVCLVPHSPGV